MRKFIEFNYATIPLLLACGCLALCFAGCPDYSHLRDEPDYQNMTDGGEEHDGEEDEEDSE